MVIDLTRKILRDARDCGADADCTAVPDGVCPTGVASGAPGLLLFRAYLEESTSTAPDASTLWKIVGHDSEREPVSFPSKRIFPDAGLGTSLLAPAVTVSAL